MLAVASFCLNAAAQVDLFGAPRTIVVAPPQVLAANALSTTNSWVDTHGYDGVAKIDIFSQTNAGGTLSVAFETSTDRTNAAALANFANAVSTSIIYTNTYYGGVALKATNTYLMPGTLTDPTASTAGWASTYLVPSPFTNSGSVTITAAAVYEIGYVIADAPRYIRVIFNATGAATNGATAAGAVLTGRRSSEVR